MYRGTMDIQTYARDAAIAFRRTSDRFGGLSNMARGYPLIVNGVCIGSSEALYQACRFPHLPQVQQLILAEHGPMRAKTRSRANAQSTRLDWDHVRVPIMAWCLRVKLAQNWDAFGGLLLSTGDASIVEDSRHDEFWAAKLIDGNRLMGQNILGRLLMELRGVLEQKPESLQCIMPPAITNFRLLGDPITRVCTCQPR